jgi:hypothetical protein
MKFFNPDKLGRRLRERSELSKPADEQADPKKLLRELSEVLHPKDTPDFTNAFRKYREAKRQAEMDLLTKEHQHRQTALLEDNADMM